eukprot:SAG22_NODE_5436_length_1014_cov_1.171585_1_plen_272_part_01
MLLRMPRQQQQQVCSPAAAAVSRQSRTGSRATRSGGGGSFRLFSTAGAPSVRVNPLPFAVYKGKSAMQLKVIPPQWAAHRGGAGAGGGGAPPVVNETVERPGVMYCEIAARPGPSAEFNWGQKITFALSVAELGKLLAATGGAGSGAAAAGRELASFVHDPQKGRAGEGQTVKTFSLARMSGDNGYFVTVATRGPAGEQRVSVPVDDGEFVVLETLCRAAIPALLGWDRVLVGPKVSWKALSFCRASTVFISKAVPFRAVPLSQLVRAGRRR